MRGRPLKNVEEAEEYKSVSLTNSQRSITSEELHYYVKSYPSGLVLTT